ncbi:MAG TPA: dTDP-4-keto-6-deoxy-D-glucose epimerase, partial [Deltaproteobacteria bacterium]|nr:dTDP-4-keto-6-deoxy-D-glucose epimerase [Deltaproteobacteria bacterium]
IPPGFAHGFCVLSETADLIYKCTDFYYPEDQFGVSWADPGIGINWPVEGPILSDKDSNLPFLKDIAQENLPRFEEI